MGSGSFILYMVLMSCYAPDDESNAGLRPTTAIHGPPGREVSRAVNAKPNELAGASL